MAVTLPQKRALFWVMGIVTGLTLMSVAWVQIHEALCRCFSFL